MVLKCAFEFTLGRFIKYFGYQKIGKNQHNCICLLVLRKVGNFPRNE